MVALSLTNKMSLDIKDCCGQYYDGAANKRGKKSGVATRILRMNELALCTHWFQYPSHLKILQQFPKSSIST